MQCANCHKLLTRDQAVVEHIVPLSRGGRNIETNTMMVHAKCHRRPNLWQRFWRTVGRLRWRFALWRATRNRPCHKTDLGYNCKHRPGECGNE